jgi:hypothetical protein
MKKLSLAFFVFITANSFCQFNGIDNNMGNLFRLSNARSRSISPENFNGAKGKGAWRSLARKPR